MKQESFTGFMTEVIKDLRQEGRFSTAHIYKYALRAVTEYVGGGEIFFSALSRRWLKRFQCHLEERQRRYNTISTYVRVLRAVYNRAVDCGVTPGEFRLFAGMKAGVASEHKLALSAEQMGKLVDDSRCSISDNGLLEAQDYLLLMLLLQGMPFADLAHLRKVDLKDGLLVCRRRKTGNELCVRVVPEAMRLIDRHRSENSSSPYLLDILSGKLEGEKAFEEYGGKLRILNRNLARLSVFCGLKDVRVSSYTARHTWATLAKYCEVPEEVISEGLGHSSLEVTRTYLKSFEGDELAKANQVVINYIYSGRKMLWKSV